jgi:hypothetical protein
MAILWPGWLLTRTAKAEAAGWVTAMEPEMGVARGRVWGRVAMAERVGTHSKRAATVSDFLRAFIVRTQNIQKRPERRSFKASFFCK